MDEMRNKFDLGLPHYKQLRGICGDGQYLNNNVLTALERTNIMKPL